METAALYLASSAMIFGSLSFFMAIIGLFKPTWVIWKPSLQTRTKAFFLWFIVSACFSIGGIMLAGAIADYYADDYRNYFVGSKGANVRECPEITCKIIDTFPANEEVKLAYPSLSDLPDWVEVTVEDKYTGQEKTGYVSKTTLSENIVPESRLTPTDNSTSAGGITIGPWSNIQMTLGDSYELYFCEPSSAISGATCGALADATTDPRGGTPPYSFIKKSGFLPPGITLELNGMLKGAPTQTGTYNFRLCAKDLYGGEGCQDLAVAVKKEESAPVSQPPIQSPKELSITPRMSVDSVSCEIVGVDPLSIEGYPDYIYVIKASGMVTGDIGSVLLLAENPSFAGGYDQYPTMLTGGWKTIYWHSYQNRSDKLLRVSGNPVTTAWSHSTSGRLSNPRTSQSVEVSAILYGNEDMTIFLGNDKATVVCSL